MVMLEGVAVVAAGLVLGLAGALVLTRLVRNLLFGITPADPVTFASAAVLLTVVAMLASYLPARRASRIDPMTAIRS
jgi:putative ABC transport system permease protein